MADTTFKRLRRIVALALFAAATVFGTSAFANPASASAAPREWDIGTYDACIEQMQDDSGPSYAVLTYCCAFSGGIWDDASGKCTAPPATDLQRRPPRVAAGSSATAPPEPASVKNG